MKNTTQVLSAQALSTQAPAEDFVVTFLIDQKNGKKENSLSFSAPGATAIDWGDGCVDEVTDKDEFPKHIYAESGVYDVRITGDIDRFCYFPAKQLIDVKQWGRSQWADVYAMFSDCVNMTMSAKDVPDLSFIKEMRGMFANCHKLNAALNDWDVSNVESMSGTFYNAKEFNQPLDDWNVSRVCHMMEMFEGAEKFNQSLDKWNIDEAKRMPGGMRDMLKNTPALHQDLSAWDKAPNGRPDYKSEEELIFGDKGPTLKEYNEDFKQIEAKSATGGQTLT